MLETLAGRLMWEQTGTEIRVEIPARRDWLVVAGSLILALVALLSFSFAVLSLLINHPDTTTWLSAFGLMVLEVLALGVLIWNLKGKTTLLLDPGEMKIMRHFLGFQCSAHTFSTRNVRNLRYLPSSGFRISRYYIPSVLCFESNDKTHKFAFGVTDVEAFALINSMIDVYDFPKDRALEYIGIRN